MEKRIIARGVLVGAIAGLLAFLFGRVFGEPVINRAIDYESARDAAQEALDRAAGLAVPAEGPDIFSRSIQQNIGIGVGMVFFGIAMGALFAVVYCLFVDRVGKMRPRTLSVLIAGGMFVSLYVVPFIKYPANPPSIGHPETIGARTGYYLLMMAFSVVFMVGAVLLGRKLADRFGNWNATVLAGLAYIVACWIVIALLPQLGHLAANADYGHFATETPQPLRDPSGHIVFPGFPADDLFQFRFDSMAAQLLLWTVIGLGFAPLAERLLGKGPRQEQQDRQPATVG